MKSMKINDWSCTQGSSSIKERCERTRVSCASTWNAVVPINVLAPQQQGNITCVLFEPLQLHSTLFAVELATATGSTVQQWRLIHCVQHFSTEKRLHGTLKPQHQLDNKQQRVTDLKQILQHKFEGDLLL